MILIYGKIYIVGGYMTNESVFVNEGINAMFRTYIRSKDKIESVEYNGFESSVIRMLILIYGIDVVTLYEKMDIDGFFKLLTCYGYTEAQAIEFVVTCSKFYKAELKKEAKAIKKKNRYFNLVQKSLIDMMMAKNAIKLVDKVILNDFYNLLFTAKSNNYYKMSYALLVAYDPYEIYEYAKKQKLVG